MEQPRSLAVELNKQETENGLLWTENTDPGRGAEITFGDENFKEISLLPRENFMATASIRQEL